MRQLTAMVTGGGGFLGQRVIGRLLQSGKYGCVYSVSRNGGDISELKVRHADARLQIINSDVTDDIVLDTAGICDVMIHLAACKYIGLCEDNPIEATRVNINGTIELLKVFSGEVFIGMSTDKAVEPVSMYGASKLIMERLILGQEWDGESRYMIVRSGNIFGSTGSVIDKWHQQISQSNRITVTDPGMTRFFVDVDDLAEFIVRLVDDGEHHNIYIPQAKSIKLETLADAFIMLYGNRDTKIHMSGAYNGERQHETLYTSSESDVITDMVVSNSLYADSLDILQVKDWLERLNGQKAYR